MRGEKWNSKFATWAMGMALAGLLALGFAGTALAQSTATLKGTVIDPSGAAVPNAKILVHNTATGVDRATETDTAGNYLVPGLLPGAYEVTISAPSFQTFKVKSLTLAVASTVTQNAQMKVGEVATVVEVPGGAPLVDTTSATVGQVINQRTVQEIPLNGRHFVDLALLTPGTVTPPANGFLTFPLRGQGSFAFNTAGQREDTVNFMINGINLNDEVQNQITFEPSINTVSEFKVDNSAYPAEYGRNSGAIVNIATRSGTNDFHGEIFEFLRNNYFDARNFFNPKTTSSGAPNPQSPFIRNNFGANAGGPIKRNKAFFFASYEGTRQRQAIALSTYTLSQQLQGQVKATSDAAIQALAALLPAANSVGTGVAADQTTWTGFLGGTSAPVNIDQGTGDLDFVLSQNDQLHGYYALQEDLRQEPTLQGNTLPNWGDVRGSRRQIMTAEENHIFSAKLTNEARLGYNRIHITFVPFRQLNPTSFSISDGITTGIGLPQIAVQGATGQPTFNFGGPAGFPQGRGDATAVFSDTLRYIRGNHSIAFGGEVRRFYNDNFNLNVGSFTFPSVTAFVNDQASRFVTNLGNGASKILEPAWGIFVEDSYKLRPNLNLDLGFRYDYNSTPSDSKNRFVVFDPASVSLVQAGTNGFGQIYHTNDKNFQPRLGIAWDPFGDGKTSVRAGYAILTDQPVTNSVTGLTTNPPFGDPLTVNGTVALTNAVAVAGPSGLAPATISSTFDNPYVQSYNLTIQREIIPTLGIQVGYIGSKGTHLRLARNLNQPSITTGLRPFPTLSTSSPIQPCSNPPCALSNITEVDSSGNSNYNALWVTAEKHLSGGLQFDASYTYSKSLDYNSLSSQGVILQDSTDPRSNYGLSDFDVRNRFVINVIYDLPFKGNRLVSGWELATIFQAQSGNPLSILMPPIGAFLGVTGNQTLRPDVTGKVQTTGDPAGWFGNTAACNPDPNKTFSGFPQCSATPNALFEVPINSSNVFHFGNLGRNSVTGPGFVNDDFSLIKNTKITERINAQFRAEVYDLLNHPNFGNPGLSVGTGNFGVIQSTRFPTGDFGSSRQIQLALKLQF